MSHAISLRRKLLMMVGGGLVVLMLGQFLGTVSLIEEREEEIIDSILAEQMNYTLYLYRSYGRVLMPNVPHMRLYVLPDDALAGRIPEAFKHLARGQHELMFEGKEYHVAIHDENATRLVLAYDVERHEERTNEVIAVMAASFLLGTAVVLVAIYWLSGRALVHLTALTRAVRDGEQTLPGGERVEREVQVLADALTDYRRQQELSLQREREFSGQLSHELRTPLTVIRTHAELLALAAPAAMQPRLADIMRRVDGLRDLITGLLVLARAQGTVQLSEVSLAPVLSKVWQDLNLAGGENDAWSGEIPAAAVVWAEPVVLEVLLRNALDNARRYGGGRVVLALDGRTLTIRDHGAALPEPQQRAAGEGRGLGIAILERAAEVMRAECNWQRLPDGNCLSIRFAAG